LYIWKRVKRASPRGAVQATDDHWPEATWNGPTQRCIEAARAHPAGVQRPRARQAIVPTAFPIPTTPHARHVTVRPPWHCANHARHPCPYPLALDSRKSIFYSPSHYHLCLRARRTTPSQGAGGCRPCEPRRVATRVVFKPSRSAPKPP
jgi:hypothetical protein